MNIEDFTETAFFDLVDTVVKEAQRRQLVGSEPKDSRRCCYGHWDTLPERCEIPLKHKTYIQPDGTRHNVLVENLPVEPTAEEKRRRKNRAAVKELKARLGPLRK